LLIATVVYRERYELSDGTEAGHYVLTHTVSTGE
jgi:hypothetical protein